MHMPKPYVKHSNIKYILIHTTDCPITNIFAPKINCKANTSYCWGSDLSNSFTSPALLLYCYLLLKRLLLGH